MTMFDFEPEDAWDALDPPGVQIRNIARRLLAIADSDLHNNERVRRRLEQAAADLDWIRARL